MNSKSVLEGVKQMQGHVGAVLKILSPVIEFLKRHKTLTVLLGIVAYLWFFTSVKSLAVTIWIILAASVLLSCAPKVWQEIKHAFSREKEGEYKTRLRWWVAAVYLLWAVAVVVMLLQSVSLLHEVTYPSVKTERHQSSYNLYAPRIPSPAPQNSAADRTATVMALLFNLYGLLGAAGVAAATANPFHWLTKKRLFWGGFALALMLGRPLVGFLAPLLGYLSCYLGPHIKGSTLLFLLAFRVLPFGIQLIAGAAFIATAALSFGVVFGALTAPIVFLFSYLLQIDQSLTIFRYQKSGMIGYVYRFGLLAAGRNAAASAG